MDDEAFRHTRCEPNRQTAIAWGMIGAGTTHLAADDVPTKGTGELAERGGRPHGALSSSFE
jgi:hypothetical protein